MGSKRKRGAKDGANATQKSQKRNKIDSAPVATTKKQSKPTFEKAPFVETPLGDERKREAGLYELLGSEDADDRIEAAECIISSLFDGEGVPEAVVQRHLDRRLFRGLASGRNASRLGFSLVITEILGQLFGEKALAESKYTGLTFDKVLAVLAEKTQAIGNIPGQEERDHFFGQLFGIECFVRAGILFSDLSRWEMVLDLLIKLANKKVWLRSQCGWVIVQAVEQMKQKHAKETLEKLAEVGLAKTPEGVATWLVALNRFPDINVKPWSNPLAKRNLSDLAAVLKESFQDFSGDQGSQVQKNKQASWSAQLHFVWDIILGYYVKQGGGKVDEFEQFWSRVVDDGLFSKNATDGQKFKGFMVFQKFLEGLVEEHKHIRCLFSKNLTTSLMNQAAKEDRFLHRSAVKALKTIEAVVSSHPATLVPVLSSILGENGAYNFDQRTSTKTVDKIIQCITKETGEEVLRIIREPIRTLTKVETNQAVSTIRVYVDYLSKSLNASSSLEDQQPVFSMALQELSQLAYSRPEGVPAEALTEQIQEHCRTRLESSFAKLSRTMDLVSLCKAVAAIDPDSVAMTEEIKEAVKEALSRMKKLLKKKTKSDEEKGLVQGLALLHAVSIFQLYNEDPEAMEVLSDLEQHAIRVQLGKSEGAEQPGSDVVLIDILMSMVARPSSLMRQVSQQVFDAFTPQLTAEGLEPLLTTLEVNESTKGQRELFNTEEDVMDVDEDGSSDDDDDDENSVIEIDSDVEFVDLEDEDEDADSGDEKNKLNQNGEWENAEDLDDQLGKILNSHRLDKDNEAEESESDADMSDSEMLAMDDKLAEVFKHRVKSRPDTKKQKKDAKQSVLNFKNRVLDFLDILVKKEPANPVTLHILIPLLRLMRTTSNKPLSSRAYEIVLKYQKGLKKARSNKEAIKSHGTDQLIQVLQDLHEEAVKDDAHAFAKAASTASLIVASKAYDEDKATVKEIGRVYEDTRQKWVLGEVKMQRSFFDDWNVWCQAKASQNNS